MCPGCIARYLADEALDQLPDGPAADDLASASAYYLVLAQAAFLLTDGNGPSPNTEEEKAALEALLPLLRANAAANGTDPDAWHAADDHDTLLLLAASHAMQYRAEDAVEAGEEGDQQLLALH